MIPQLYTTTVTISRRSFSGQNAGGEKIPTWTNVYTNIPARIEESNSKVQYRTSTERDNNFTITYVPAAYIPLVEDRIYHGSTYLGIASGVDKALGQGNTTDHYEIIIENP